MESKQKTLVKAIPEINWESNFRDLWRLLVPAVLLAAVFSIPQFDRTPFIDTFQDLVKPSSSWLFQNEQWFSVREVNRGLIIGSLFILILTYFLYQLYYTFKSSPLEDHREDQEGRYQRHLRSRWWYREKIWRPEQWLFAAMLITSLIELFLISRQLKSGTYDFERPGITLLSTLAFLFRIICLAMAVYMVLKVLLNDFLKSVLFFLQRFLSYFYPSLLAIIILGVVLANMDQMDSLFIELVNEPLNFLLFSLFLFPASLIIIWFTPAYLQLTDALFLNEEDERDQSIRYLLGPTPTFWSHLKVFRWLYLHKRLLLPPEDEQTVSRNFDLETGAKVVPETTYAFHLSRLILGVLYIIILAGICFRVYWDNDGNPAFWQSLVPILTTVLAFGYLYVAQRSLNAGDPLQIPRKKSFGDPGKKKPIPLFFLYKSFEKTIRKIGFIKKLNARLRHRGRLKARHLVKNKLPFYIFILAAIICIVLFFITLIFILLKKDWEYPFLTFLCFTAVSVFLFIGVAVYRQFFKTSHFERNTPSDNFMDALDYSITSVVLLFLPAIAVLALAYFLAGLFSSSFLSSGFVKWINPLNIYLLLINGFIALLLLIDRSILLQQHLQEYKKQGFYRQKSPPQYRFWAVVIVAFILGQSFYGNSYNEIRYHKDPETDDRLDLSEYTRSFLDRLESQPSDGDPKKRPVILIASDGGGLKAAYWTLLNLYKLDSELGLFDNNVFLSSGASGGAIGLGMYTYLKAKDRKTDAELEDLIQTIGQTNFLSGDFTGLLTRFPLRYWPDRLNIITGHRLDDRMDAMARSYFNLCTEKTSPYSFDSLRVLPYYSIWERNNYELPLYILNTSRAEDGMRGIAHPLKPDKALTSGVVDLSNNAGGQFISFPEALFLTNRFPVFSPAGKIEGKGNFIDAGAVENSGLGTVYQFLEVMKARTDTLFPGHETFTRFFEHPVIILSIRNAKSRFVRDNFYSFIDAANLSFHSNDLNANANAAINSGLSGAPYYWDDRLLSDESKALIGYDAFLRIDLPFRLEKHDPHLILHGQITHPAIRDSVEQINQKIYNTACPDNQDDQAGDPCLLVMPPLGRLLSDPVRDYMQRMVNYPDNLGVYKILGTYGRGSE